VIANSEFTRDELLNMGVSPARITLIYPGVDVARFRPGLAFSDLRASVGVGPNGKLILSVGRLSRRKGFDQVILSLPTLVSAGLDVHYALIGIGEDQDYLLELAREHGVAARVHLIGHVSADDLPRWYNACDVFAMPNREINGDTEGFGMVFIEAAACGKPSVAGLAGGTGAAVLDGVTGLRIAGDSLPKVTTALGDILGTPQLSQRLGQLGYTRATNEFGWSQVAIKTAKLSEQQNA
jgi:phosphatidylinositol alpha-1,6-mannosyltransferase